MDDVPDVIVIGGGAAGMAAAIAAAECGESVLLLERMDRVGKKLLATGNGRCNLMNTGAPRYPGGEAFARAVLARCGAQEQRRFWLSHGLNMRSEEGGRVYPASGQATTVLDVLRLALEACHVQTLTGTAVTALQRRNGAWQVHTGHGSHRAMRVIVACGGCAQPKLGSDGSGYALLRSAGHRMVPVQPALTQIETDTAPIRGLSGIRLKCSVMVERHGHTMHREQGEALLTDYGVSGVCVMQCARYARKGDQLVLDLLPAMGMERPEEALGQLVMRHGLWKHQPMESLLTGLCVPRLASALCRAAGVSVRERLIGSLTEDEMRRLVSQMSGLRLTVRGVKGYDTAQVTSGGIATDDFDPATLMSRLAGGLHAAGEVLDVDGDCGGFNLMFAFGSGLLAGLNGRNAPWQGGLR